MVARETESNQEGYGGMVIEDAVWLAMPRIKEKHGVDWHLNPVVESIANDFGVGRGQRQL